MPDGEGAISGILKISADGQELVYIRLTGYSSNPKIITTTEELNMEDVIRVKYVPYSYTVETNNKDDSNRVTFSVAEGKLAEGSDYTSEEGSTRVTILNQTLTRKSVGTHTLGMEFRTQDTRELRRAAQNYVVGEDANTDNGEHGGNSNNGGNSGNDSNGGNGSNSGGEGNDEAENRGEDEDAGDAGNAEAGSRLRATATVITHTVSAGDTLWKIAEKYFGSDTP